MRMCYNSQKRLWMIKKTTFTEYELILVLFALVSFAFLFCFSFFIDQHLSQIIFVMSSCFFTSSVLLIGVFSDSIVKDRRINTVCTKIAFILSLLFLFIFREKIMSLKQIVFLFNIIAIFSSCFSLRHSLEMNTIFCYICLLTFPQLFFFKWIFLPISLYCMKIVFDYIEIKTFVKVKGIA